MNLDARDLKVGWVSQQAVNESQEGKLLEKEVTESHRALAKEVESKQKAYMDAANALNAKAAALTQEAREAEAEKVNDLKIAYEKSARNAEQQMQKKIQVATQEALKSFSLAVEEYAKSNGFDIILSEAGAVYVNKEVDATQKVSVIMNKQHEIKVAQNKKTNITDSVKVASAPKANTEAPKKTSDKV